MFEAMQQMDKSAEEQIKENDDFERKKERSLEKSTEFFDEIPKEELEKQGESEEILIGGSSDPTNIDSSETDLGGSASSNISQIWGETFSRMVNAVDFSYLDKKKVAIQTDRKKIEEFMSSKKELLDILDKDEDPDNFSLESLETIIAEEFDKLERNGLEKYQDKEVNFREEDSWNSMYWQTKKEMEEKYKGNRENKQKNPRE